MGPAPQAAPPKFASVAVLSGNAIWAAAVSWVFSVAPDCSAAAVVMTLNVDPGG